MAEVELRQVDKEYPGRAWAIRDLSLRVADGEFAVLVSPSGCSKTTTLRIVAGLEGATRGEVWIGGRRVDEVPPRDRNVAMVFQNYALYPHMTVFENLAFGLRRRRLAPAEIRRRVAEVAQTLGLEGLLGRRPSALSSGQRQRVALGRAMVREPAVFLSDEPLSNLDAQLRVQMRVELRHLHRRLGATMLYVTHDQVEAMTLADRVAVMHEGRLRQWAPPLEVYDRPADLFVASFVGHPPMNLLRGHWRRREGQWWFDSGGLTWRIAGAERFGASPDREVVWGIRPENLRPSMGGSGSTGQLRVTVAAAEPLGSETLLHLDCSGHQLVARLRERGEHSGVIWVAPDADRQHFFDAATGARLPWTFVMLDDLGPLGQVAAVMAGAFIILAGIYSAVKYEWTMRAARAGTAALGPMDLLTLAVSRRVGDRSRRGEFAVICLDWDRPAEEDERSGRVRALAGCLRRGDDVISLSADRTVVVANIPVSLVGRLEGRWRSRLGPQAGFRMGVSAWPADGDDAERLLSAAADRLGRPPAPPADPPVTAPPPAPSDMLDPLTGLLRPEKIDRAARKYISQCRYSGRPVTVMHIDIFRLEEINERFGREAGDAVVANCAQVLSDSLRQSDFLGRLEGDEFLAILECPPAAAEKAAARLVAVTRESSASLGPLRLPYSIHIGIAGIGGMGSSPANVLDAATLALRRAERQGPGRWVVYQRAMEEVPPEPRPVEDVW